MLLFHRSLSASWENVTNKKMYVTGAVGQTHYGASTNRDKIEEGFIDEYMMPNMTAYNETCANLTNSFFSYRMLGLHGKSKYADIIELVLFNSALSGISIGGKQYYYANPLRVVDGSRDYSKMNTEFPVRQDYLECFCCPPNLVRTIAQSSSWAYSLAENGVSVNLYGGNKLHTKLADGSCLSLIQETQKLMNEDNITPSATNKGLIKEKIKQIKQLINPSSEFSTTAKACLESTGLKWAIKIAS